MAISTYTDLQTSIATYLNRSNLTARIPEWIQFAESRIAYGSREPQFLSEPLRIRSMETSASLNITGQTVPLPTGYLQSRRMYLATDPVQELDYIVPDVFWRTYVSSTQAMPTEFTVEGENIVLGPIPDATYTAQILYYAKFSTLSQPTDTNWLLTNAPMVYLSGALIEAFKFTRNLDSAQVASSQFAGLINSLNLSDKADRYSGSPWMAKTDTGNP